MSVTTYKPCATANTCREDDAPHFFQNVIQAKGRDDGTGFLSFLFKRSTATFAPIQNDRTP